MQDKFYAFYPVFFLFSLMVTFIFERKLVSLLSGKATQPIYTEGPSWHTKKSGTPTMGGLAFLPILSFCLIFSLILIAQKNEKYNTAISISISVAFVILNSLVGIFDDYMKLWRRENRGLSPGQKLFLQLLISVLFLMARIHYLDDSTVIAFPFGEIDFGFLYYPLALIIILGIVNCANLTDGIDGLACSVAAAVGIVFFLLSASSNTDTKLLSLLMASIATAFLFFNINPAKIFMGDTGSLLFGALSVSCAFSLKNPFLAVIIGGVYVIEGISVILQVLFFKTMKKRLFKMAPLHHHLEKCGFDENKICLIAVIFTFVISVFAWKL